MPYALPLQQQSRQEHDLTQFGFPEIPLVGADRRRACNRGLELHQHVGAMEICYNVSGEQTYRVEERDYTLRANDLFITYPDEWHSTGNQPEGKGTIFWIQIYLPTRPTRFLGYGARQAKLLVERLRQIRVRHFPGDPRLKRMFESILLHAKPADELEQIQLGVCLVDWLLLVIQCAKRAEQGAGAGRLTPDLRRVCNALASDPATDWTVDQMAEIARLSPSRFKAKFKAYLGVPPREYLLRLRVDQARQRLRESNVSITDLAYELGFSSSQYFATVFKRFTFRRPSEERESPALAQSA